MSLRRIAARTGWVLICLVAVTSMLVYARVARGGELDPAAAPTPTMKTLDEIPGSWSRRLDNTNGAPQGNLIPPPGCDSDRFRCVLRYDNCAFTVCVAKFEAVLDRETGLVWERNPSPTAQAWLAGLFTCERAIIGQRGGWRVPSLAEAQTLLNGSLNVISPGPFVNTSGALFWTRTAYASDASLAGTFGDGNVTFYNKMTAQIRVMCVRGANGLDGAE